MKYQQIERVKKQKRKFEDTRREKNSKNRNLSEMCI